MSVTIYLQVNLATSGLAAPNPVPDGTAVSCYPASDFAGGNPAGVSQPPGSATASSTTSGGAATLGPVSSGNYWVYVLMFNGASQWFYFNNLAGLSSGDPLVCTMPPSATPTAGPASNVPFSRLLMLPTGYGFLVASASIICLISQLSQVFMQLLPQNTIPTGGLVFNDVQLFYYTPSPTDSVARGSMSFYVTDASGANRAAGSWSFGPETLSPFGGGLYSWNVTSPVDLQWSIIVGHDLYLSSSQLHTTAGLAYIIGIGGQVQP